MLTSEREQFEDELGVLCAGFDVPLTPARKEAYWRGLNRMQLGTFTRVVGHMLSEDGPAELPTAPKIWQIYHELRRGWNRPATETQKPKIDSIQAFGNRHLIVFLGRQADLTGYGASQNSLIELVRAKNKIVESAQDDQDIVRAIEADLKTRTDEEKAVLEQLSEIFNRAFATHWQPRTPQEIAQDREHYWRTGRMRSFTESELARLGARSA